jgi:hypothetical protein
MQTEHEKITGRKKKHRQGICTHSYMSNEAACPSASTSAERCPFLYAPFSSCSAVNVSVVSALCQIVEVIPPLENACSEGMELP